MNNTETNWSEFVLLLIDVQEDFWPDATASTFPDFPQKVTSLLTLARKQGIDLVHLQAKFKHDRSDWMVKYKIIDRRLPCIEQTSGAEVLPFAQSIQGEEVIIKKTFDGFCNPELQEYLKKNGKRFILTAGLVTSICVLLTSASAAQRGYLVGIVEDCCADNLEAHEMALQNYPFIFERVTVEQIIANRERWLKEIRQIQD